MAAVTAWPRSGGDATTYTAVPDDDSQLAKAVSREDSGFHGRAYG